MPYEPGDIVVVKFPFTNQRSAKQRPAVVISRTDYNTSRPDVILLAITSQIRTPLGLGEAIIEDWQDAGLLKASLFKPVLFTAGQTLIRKPLGKLSQRDQRVLANVIDSMIIRQI